MCVLLVAAFVAPARADEIWVAPTAQQDLGGLGIGSNVVWPVTPAGAVRFAWAVPDDLQTFQSAKVVLIPQAAVAASTLNVLICSAQHGDVAGGGSAGPFAQAFTGSANQLVIGSNRCWPCRALRTRIRSSGFRRAANPTGSFNSFVGNGAGMQVSTGSNNTFFGSGSGNQVTDGASRRRTVHAGESPSAMRAALGRSRRLVHSEPTCCPPEGFRCRLQSARASEISRNSEMREGRSRKPSIAS
jgi:hypothetical protein